MTDEILFERYKFRCERHRKACQTCKYHSCLTNCNVCEINHMGDVRTCPCLNLDKGKKYARCEHYKRAEVEE